MKRFILFIFITYTLTSFSFANNHSQSFHDVSFPILRETTSLATITNHKNHDSLFDFLNWLNTDPERVLHFLLDNNNFSRQKKDLFQFLLLGRDSQKRVFHFLLDNNNFPPQKRNPFQFLLLGRDSQKKVLEKSIPSQEWINSALEGEDISHFQTLHNNESLTPLYSLGTLLPMSHLFLSLADPKIITKVFQTKGFDPDFKDSFGNNLLHNFLIFRSKATEEKDLIEALKLLIELSPEKLLTEKNSFDITPIEMALRLNDKISYEILMEAIPSQAFSEMLPALEKASINRGLLTYLKSIHRFREKHDFPDNAIITLPDHSILMRLGNREKDTEAPIIFKDSSLENSIVIFHFKPLITELDPSLDYAFYENNNYESARLAHIQNVFLGLNKSLHQLQPIYRALFDKDINALKIAFKNFDHNIPLNEFNEGSSLNSPEGLAQIILEESFRNHFKEGVLFSIEDLNNTDAFFYDPIFLSLLSYATLHTEHPNKEEAKTIIQTLASAISKQAENEAFTFAFWSAYFGLYDELKYFLEEMKMEFDKEALMNIRHLAYKKGYLNIYNYIINLINTEQPNENCKKIFLN